MGRQVKGRVVGRIGREEPEVNLLRMLFRAMQDVPAHGIERGDLVIVRHDAEAHMVGPITIVRLLRPADYGLVMSLLRDGALIEAELPPELKVD